MTTEEHDRPEWGGWRIVSDMLDHPDEHGIYPTSKCYKQLYDFVVSQKKEVIREVIRKYRKESFEEFDDVDDFIQTLGYENLGERECDWGIDEN